MTVNESLYKGLILSELFYNRPSLYRNEFKLAYYLVNDLSCNEPRKIKPRAQISKDINMPIECVYRSLKNILNEELLIEVEAGTTLYNGKFILNKDFAVSSICQVC